MLDYNIISEQLKKRVEIRFGKPIRYPKDCRSLSIELEKVCKRKVSAATLMRIFGIINESSNPTLHTLDLLAEFAGFECCREVSEPNYIPMRTKKSNCLKLADFNIGSSINISTQDSKLTLVKLSQHDFEISAQKNTNLEVRDRLTILRIDIGFPIICECVARAGNSMGPYCFDWQNKVVNIT